MQAFGRVHEMLRRVAAPSQDTAPPTVDSLISSLQVSGQGTFNSQQWEQLIALRKCLPPKHAEIFKMCQFSLCAGRVRVKASDFGLAAKLDPRAPWVKVALMLWQYIGSADQHHVSADAKTFTGRKEIQAKKISKDVTQDPAAETDFVLGLDIFIKNMIQQYPPPPTNESRQAVASELLNARGAMLANCGRYILKVGAVLDQAAKKASSKDDDLTLAAREEVLRAEADNKINKIEDCFRKDLLKRKLYTEDDIPPAKYPVQVKKAPSQEQTSEVAPTRSLVAEVFVAAETLTDTHVFERLGVKGCGEEVMAFVKK